MNDCEYAVKLNNGAMAMFPTKADLNLFLLELGCEYADDGVSVIRWGSLNRFTTIGKVSKMGDGQ